MISREDMLELTRRMTSSRTHLTRLAGAYIDEEGYVDTTFNTNFLKLSGQEKSHCIEIAKTIPFAETNVELTEHLLPSGAFGKDSIWRLLYALRDAELKNDALLLDLYEIFAEKMPKGSPYAIYIFQGMYDVPSKGTDKERQGESESVFNYLICAVCPLLGNEEADLPTEGFLWPAFKERGAAMDYVNFYRQGFLGQELKAILGI